MLRSLLERDGFEVAEAAGDGAEALNAVDRLSPDAIRARPQSAGARRLRRALPSPYSDYERDAPSVGVDR